MRPRKIIWAFQDFMRRRRLAKACPEHARLREQREEASKRHQAREKLYRQHVALTNGLLRE